MNQFIKSHFVIFLLGSMILGLFLPGPFAPIGDLVVPLLGGLMVLSFLSIDYALLLKRLSRPKDAVIVFFLIKIILPALLYWVLRPLDPIIALAVLLITAAPAAAVSPTLTGLCNGDTEFVLVILMITSVLSPFTLPLTINLLAGTSIAIDVIGMLMTLLQIIIVPLGVALLLNRFLKKAVEKAKPFLGSVSVILLAVLLAGLVAQGAPDIWDHFALFPRYLLISTILGIFLTLAGYFFFPFFDRGKRIGLAICTSYINVGLAIVLASRYFPVEVMIFTLIFELPVNVIPGILQLIFKKAVKTRG